jgi:hypothetical protein
MAALRLVLFNPVSFAIRELFTFCIKRYYPTESHVLRL